jgi:hypothetical protein
MKIITAFFARKSFYNKLLRVFKNSCKSVMPGIKIEIIKPLKPHKNIDHKRDTAFAFLDAAYYVLKQRELIAVCDCDMMFLKSIEYIEDKEFDIAVTTRDKIKFNTGLWFYRPSERSRLFVIEWINQTKKIMENFCRYEEFCHEHGGIDQASLFVTVKKLKRKIKLLELPCSEWNSTQSEWKEVDKNTRIVHIKSKLRLLCSGRIDPATSADIKYLLPLKEKWESFL